jgi:hypothetical protein
MKKEVEVEERLCDIKDQLDTLMIYLKKFADLFS